MRYSSMPIAALLLTVLPAFASAQPVEAPEYDRAPVPRAAGAEFALGRPVPVTPEAPKLMPPSSFMPPNQAIAPPTPITWEEAPKYMGQEVTVIGEIVSTRAASQNVHLLYFSDNADSGFYLAVFADVFDEFPAPPVEHFLGQRIEVTGPVSSYRGRPQVRVDQPGQLSIVPAVD